MTPALDFDDIQSPVLRRRPAPYCGCHALLKVNDPAQGRALLTVLIPHVVSAAQYGSREAWVALGITHAGLRALGLPQRCLDSFPLAFRQGMAARAGILGDVGENAPEHWDPPYGTDDVHIALTLLSTTDQVWRQSLATARAHLDALPGVHLLLREDFAQLPGGRTPLGYRDGISFPHIQGNDPNPIASPEASIAAGEFILGYPGEAGRHLPMPQPEVLGRNGTFVGFCKLGLRVAAFRRYLQANATARHSQDMLAAKLMGRWPSGAPLVLAPEKDDPELAEDLRRVNDFAYTNDPMGLSCPLGSHIRRMNPRDTRLNVMTDVRIHRIIRHGTAYGPELPPGVTQDDDQDRGIFFLFISATVPETFEFLKAEWANNGNFLGLGEQRDPIAGRHSGDSVFTLPMRPVRRRLHQLEDFSITRGGEYCFMPGLSALRWIADGRYQEG